MEHNLTGRILVVDDSEGMRHLCHDVLTLAGYVVETASDGSEALGLLKERPYDLVLTDIEMSGLDGISLYRSAVHADPGLKERFIFMTGYTSGEKVSFIRGQRKVCLTKPFGNKELLCRINIYLAMNYRNFWQWYSARAV